MKVSSNAMPACMIIDSLNTKHITLLLPLECDILTAADALTERFLIFFFSGSLVSSLARFTGGPLLSTAGGCTLAM